MAGVMDKEPPKAGINPLVGKAQLGPLAMGCVIVNGTMGMGFLTLPYAFQQAGLVASGIALFIMWLIAVSTARFMIDVMAHANAIKLKYPDLDTVHEGTPLLAGETQLRRHQVSVEEQRPLGQELFNADTPITMTELAYIFYGPKMRFFVMIGVQLTAYTTMVGYAVLVASSLAESIDFPEGAACNVYDSAECMARYRSILLLFGVFGTLLASLDVQEQISFQVLMTAGRFFVVVSITAECMLLLASESTPLGEWGSVRGAPIFTTNFAAIPQVIGLSTFALGVNILLPDLVQDLAEKKRLLNMTVDSAVSVCGWTFFLIGTIVPVVFGSRTLPLCTLNFSRLASMPKFLQQVLILLPVVDVTASFPLYGHTLASNMHEMLKEGLGTHAPPPMVSRVISGAAPIFIAWFVYDISIAAAWVGIGVALVGFVLPAVFWHKAVAEGERLFTPAELASNPFRCEIARPLSNLVVGGTLLMLVFAVRGALTATAYESEAPEEKPAALIARFYMPAIGQGI